MERNLRDGVISPLLKLPAEVRNGIYSHCGPEPFPNALLHPHVSSTTRQRLRAYIKLAHINRQIRDEFLSMHVQTVDYRIKFADLPMTRFSMEGLSRTAMGTVTIDISDMEAIIEKKGINVRPLFEFCRTQHCVRVIIASPLPPRIPGSAPPKLAQSRYYELEELLTNILAPGNSIELKKGLSFYDRAATNLIVSVLREKSGNGIESLVRTCLFVRTPYRYGWISSSSLTPSNMAEPSIRWLGSTDCAASYEKVRDGVAIWKSLV